MSRLLIVLCVAGFAITASGIGRMQSIAAKGQLKCKGEAASGIKIKLMDHNTIVSDDMLAQADSDQNGNFYLAGHRTEISSVAPELKIYHSCDHYFEQCTKLRIPDSYVTSGKTPEQAYNIGTLHLEAAADSC